MVHQKAKNAGLDVTLTPWAKAMPSAPSSAWRRAATTSTCLAGFLRTRWRIASHLTPACCRCLSIGRGRWPARSSDRNTSLGLMVAGIDHDGRRLSGETPFMHLFAKEDFHDGIVDLLKGMERDASVYVEGSVQHAGMRTIILDGRTVSTPCMRPSSNASMRSGRRRRCAGTRILSEPEPVVEEAPEPEPAKPEPVEVQHPEPEQRQNLNPIGTDRSTTKDVIRAFRPRDVPTGLRQGIEVQHTPAIVEHRCAHARAKRFPVGLKASPVRGDEHDDVVAFRLIE